MAGYWYDGCYYSYSSGHSHDNCGCSHSHRYWHIDCCCPHPPRPRHDDCRCFESSRFSNHKKEGHKMDDCGRRRHDDCCKDCKKEKCDCCCVPGIKEQFRRGQTVVIFVDNTFFGVAIAGKVMCVDCDTVTLGPPGNYDDPIGTPIVDIDASGTFSLCDISAVFPV